MFQSGEFVVYGAHGVCQVIGTEHQLVNRKRTEYLILEPISQQESKYYIPTHNTATMSKLHPVLTVEELESLLKSSELRYGVVLPEESIRKQQYRDLICSGNRIEILKMICALYRFREEQITAGRKFHQCDENFLRDAEKLISSEIAQVTGQTLDEAREYLRNLLK